MHTKFQLENLKGRKIGRHRHRWKGNTRMDLREIGWEDVNWMNVAQDREHRNESSSSMKGEGFLD